MKKLFTNDKFFLAMVLCAVIGNILITVFKANTVNLELWVKCIIHISCIVALYVSYRKHSKNVMKGMIGALLMNHLLQALSSMSSASGIDVPFSIVYFILIAMLFIDHFVINSNRYATPRMVRLNQIIVLLIFATILLWDVIWLINSATVLNGIYMLSDLCGAVCLFAVVVCVESRLDAYRLDREAAGWTEESGYPEGYVHEYEKKNGK